MDPFRFCGHFSQIGGAMAGQIAARLLQNTWGGKGILMGGVPGVPPAEAVVLGAGVVGTYATQTLPGHGCARDCHRPHLIARFSDLWDRFPCLRDFAFHAPEYRTLGLPMRMCSLVQFWFPGERTPDTGHATNGAGDAAALSHHGPEHRRRGMRGDFPARPLTNVLFMSRKASCTIACQMCRARWLAPRHTRL